MTHDERRAACHYLLNLLPAAGLAEAEEFLREAVAHWTRPVVSPPALRSGYVRVVRELTAPTPEE